MAENREQPPRAKPNKRSSLDKADGSESKDI